MSDQPLKNGSESQTNANRDAAAQHPNDGPAHEGRRSDAGGTYGDFNRADKSADTGPVSDPTVVIVEEVFDTARPRLQGT